MIWVCLNFRFEFFGVKGGIELLLGCEVKNPNPLHSWSFWRVGYLEVVPKQTSLRKILSEVQLWSDPNPKFDSCVPLQGATDASNPTKRNETKRNESRQPPCPKARFR